MYSLHLLLRASPAALLLTLCLQLGITKAQEDTTISSPHLITMDLQMLPTDSSEEATVVLEVATDLKECMVIKCYLLSNIPIEGNFNYKFTSCLCNNNSPKRFFWDLQTNSTVRVTAVVDVIRQLGICPDDWAVIPIKANRFSLTKNLP